MSRDKTAHGDFSDRAFQERKKSPEGKSKKDSHWRRKKLFGPFQICLSLIVPSNNFFSLFYFRTFAAGNKIKQFYELLVEDSLRREDVDTMSRENMKNLHELMQSFRFSNVCYWSYLSRTCLEIVLSISLFLIYWCWGMPNLEREIECDVHGIRHSCVLPNHQFYLYILAASSALLCVYILCNMYNLVWIVCPQLGTMYRIIKKYQEHEADNLTKAFELKRKSIRSPPCISTENFLAVYFDRRHKDLKLLLNLLAETSGLPESFRILTLFDKKFQSLWKPQNLRFEEYETVVPSQKLKSHSIIVRWNDAPIGHFLANYDSSLSFEYTIDINPGPLNELGLKSVLYKKDPKGVPLPPTTLDKNSHSHLNPTKEMMTATINSGTNNVESFHLLETGGDGGTSDGMYQDAQHHCQDQQHQQPSSGNGTEKFRYEVTFDNIVSHEEEYVVTISTELNGRTVTQMVERFPMGSPETPIMAAPPPGPPSILPSSSPPTDTATANKEHSSESRKETLRPDAGAIST